MLLLLWVPTKPQLPVTVRAGRWGGGRVLEVLVMGGAGEVEVEAGRSGGGGSCTP